MILQKFYKEYIMVKWWSGNAYQIHNVRARQNERTNHSNIKMINSKTEWIRTIEAKGILKTTRMTNDGMLTIKADYYDIA